ncbi:MAG: hypothetical protein RL264_847 [Bacteroidota bacterium]|jgi:dolichyl-phosphate beta-glucosyltransferase
MTDKQQILSIVIPSFESPKVLENNLPVLFQFLNSIDFESEVIVVNDGSKNTKAYDKIGLDFGCKIIHLPANEGKGTAIKTGFSVAKGGLLFFTDADIPFEPNNFLRFIEALKKSEIAIGDRHHPDSVYFDRIPNQRRWGSGIFTNLVRNWILKGFMDTQCGLKGFQRHVALELVKKTKISGFAFDVEWLKMAQSKNWKIAKVPVTFRNQEGSSVRLFRHGATMLWNLVQIKYMKF